MTEEKIETIPATEESLMIENDVHPFDADLPKTVNFDEQMHQVLVDGIKGKACTGTLGGCSERIRINLEEEHPELGKDFQTKPVKDGASKVVFEAKLTKGKHELSPFFSVPEGELGCYYAVIKTK